MLAAGTATAPHPDLRLALVLIALVALAAAASYVGRLGVERNHVTAGVRATVQLGIVSLVIAVALESVWVLCWAVGTTVLFGALSSVIITGRLAERGPGIGVVTSMPSVVAGVLVSVTVGFALGSAARSVAIPLMLGYVGATALPLLDAPSKGLTRAIDLDTARAAIAGAEPPHGIGLVIVALCVWTVVPAALAVIRLRRGDLR